MTFIEAIQAAIANPGKIYVNSEIDWIQYKADAQVLNIVCESFILMTATWHEDT